MTESIGALTTGPSGDGSQLIFVARQPIFDRHGGVVAYELLFRSGPENRFTATDVEAASAIGMEQSATAFGLDELVGQRLAFINMSRGALLRGFYKLLPRERTVVELLEDVEPDLEVLEACRDLKEAGYRLALDDFVDAPRSLPLLAYADCVKVDFRRLVTACDPRLIERMRRHEVHMLAEKVETHPEHDHALDAGYDLFQGYYYCRPQMIETRDLPPSKLSHLRFLAAVSREDASFDELEEVFRQDVGLTMRLLRYLNSAAFGWRYEITSLHHALSLMGLRPLRKWATMMGFVALAEDRPHELAVTALTRARFAEQLGPPSGLVQHELELFLTGMLSTAEAMVGRPLPELLGGLAVSDPVREALVEGGTPLGGVLRMVTSYERGDWSAVESARAVCDIDDASLSEAYIRSLRWAEAAARV